MIPDRPSAYLRSALEKVSNLRLLFAAYRDGTLSDPWSMERDINRAEKEIAYCIGLLDADPPAHTRDYLVPSLDNDPVLARFVNGCETCSED